MTMPGPSSGARYLAIGACTVATAAIHVSRALVNPHIRVLFTLNALGYLCLLALFVLPLRQGPARRSLVRRVFLGYVALTFVLFFAWGLMKGEWPVIGFVDKGVEVALFVLLGYQGKPLAGGRLHNVRLH